MTGRRLRLQIRYSDLDTLGHVNNAVYLTYFELGRIDYLRHSLGTLEISEISFVIAHAEVDFRRPIHFDDKISIETSIGSVGNSSIRFDHLIVDESENIFASGKTVAVWIGKDKKPTPVPDSVREKLLQTGESV
ncbi:MAG TPA: thioesterase family protein [Thermoplasmataceae archaeon]|nr:thioesterase family protein [Thermoplasmataceae archaeon]